MREKINTNIRIDSEIKEKAKKIAEAQGTDLNTVLNGYLIDFVEMWEVRCEKSQLDSEKSEIEALSAEDVEKLKKMPNFRSLIQTFSWM